MVTSYTDPALWGVIALIGLITFAIRLSFIALFGRFDEIPPRLGRALRYVPAAVLAALVAPEFVTLQPAAGGLAVDKLLAGGVAAAVAWHTEDIFATILSGMGALWAARFLLLPLF